MASINIIYATTSGNTELVVDKVSAIFESKGHDITLHRVSQSQPEDILKKDLCILASPTYGQGVLHEYFIPFIEAMKKVDLKGQKCAIIGLGDPRYHIDYHLESVPLLQEAIQAAKGEIIGTPLMISGSPVKHLDGLVKMWTEKMNELIT